MFSTIEGELGVSSNEVQKDLYKLFLSDYSGIEIQLIVIYTVL